MKLTAHSKNKLIETFAQYEIPKEYADPVFNYLVHGYHPGGFWSAVFANDFMSAIARSHPANSVVELKKVVSWMMNHLINGTTHGSYQVVDMWLKQTPEVRRATLENLGLIYTEQSEIMLILKGTNTYEPHLW